MIPVVSKIDFKINRQGAPIKFRFEDIEEFSPDATKSLHIEGYLEVKDMLEKEDSKVGLMGAFGALDNKWRRRFYELEGVMLSVYEVKKVNVDQEVKVLLDVYELTEWSYIKEIKPDRDKKGLAEGKPLVMNLITLEEPNETQKDNLKDNNEDE